MELTILEKLKNALQFLDNFKDNHYGEAIDLINDKTDNIYEVAKTYKENNIDWIAVADENYGEGSSREHAAMEPRHLGIKAVIVKSFARIHETNLKKQGMLALTFDNESDYDKIKEDDTFNFIDLESFSPGRQLSLELVHKDQSKEIIKINHTFNSQQIEWYRNGSALNLIKANNF